MARAAFVVEESCLSVSVLESTFSEVVYHSSRRGDSLLCALETTDRSLLRAMGALETSTWLVGDACKRCEVMARACGRVEDVVESSSLWVVDSLEATALVGRARLLVWIGFRGLPRARLFLVAVVKTGDSETGEELMTDIDVFFDVKAGDCCFFGVILGVSSTTEERSLLLKEAAVVSNVFLSG